MKKKQEDKAKEEFDKRRLKDEQERNSIKLKEDTRRKKQLVEQHKK